ncbi:MULTISPECIES: ABC transporter ATP-binding protein [unclassified Haladaptatus]|uniref:ABC transporter ATP-binding protein n=1 Tax=unclassified Haladaptatus TaxID=2622732 RepID=UPI0023E8A9B1|nr:MULTISPECIES: ABC transporter ATP-binding protein [unclassified Haladaptatus]
MALVELRGVVKRYELGGETLTVLKGVDFAIEPGEFVAVMGPSGSGKSTMLNMIGLLDEPSEGTVLLDGEDVTTLSDRDRTKARQGAIGFIFQDFYLIPSLTATENVELPTLFGGAAAAEGRVRAEQLLTDLGLGDRLDHLPSELSGGQQQRVAIARSLVNEPRVLLADEPTGNLDQKTGREILERLRAICDEGVGIVAVTHDPNVAAFADRRVNIVDGVITGEEVVTDV